MYLGISRGIRGCLREEGWEIKSSRNFRTSGFSLGLCKHTSGDHLQGGPWSHEGERGCHSSQFCPSPASVSPTVACVWAQALSCVQLVVTPWTVARPAPLSMGFSRQGYWSGLPFPFPTLIGYVDPIATWIAVLRCSGAVFCGVRGLYPQDAFLLQL